MTNNVYLNPQLIDLFSASLMRKSINTVKNHLKESKEPTKRAAGKITTPYLTTQRAEAKSVKKTSLTRLARIGHAFSRSWLRPFIQKYYTGTVDNVSLYRRDIQQLLNFGNSNNIVVRRSPDLQICK